MSRATHKVTIGAVLAIGTLTSPAFGYRTAAELPTIASETPVSWKSQHFSYEVANRAPAGILLAEFQRAVAQAVSSWTLAECATLTVRDLGTVPNVARPDDGINTIEWIPSGWLARGFDPDVPGQTDVSYEKDATGVWRIKEADIYLNGEQNTWDLAGETQTGAWSVRSVVLHEVGHALGLLHPCEIVGSSQIAACSSSPEFKGLAMNPIYDAQLSTLSSDDQAGICAIYPRGMCLDRICLDSETCTASGCRATCGATACEGEQVCESGRCLAPSSVLAPIDGAARDASCAANTDCQRGLTCVSGRCTGGPLKLGDLCSKDRECQDGVCTQMGYCAEACRTGEGCDEAHASCEQLSGGIGACLGMAQPLGTPCDSADDCIGQECLVDGERPAVCTRACDDDATPCPNGWSCASVEGKNICVSAATESGCDCRSARSSRQNGIGWILPLLLSTIMFQRRRQGGARRVA